MKTLPAGLLNDDYEFFNAFPEGSVVDVYCLHAGSRFSYEEFPLEAYAIIDAYMSANPKKIDAMIEIGIDDLDEQRKKCISCNFGGFDCKPDTKNGLVQETEYWPCPQRGNCPVEGKLCNSLKTPSGAHLTKREIEVLKLVAEGLFDKQIASTLNMNEHTVKTHNKNIQAKLGGSLRKVDMSRFAFEHNLI